MNPRFLSVDDVIALHVDQIDEFGGEHGVKSMDLLESAVSQPRAALYEQYLHEDLPAMAAAYLFHIVQNHAFHDGNKRTGLAAALVFLEINGMTLEESSTERLYEATLAVAQSRMKKPQLTQLLSDLFWNPPE